MSIYAISCSITSRKDIKLQKLFVILTSCLAKEQLVKDKSEDGSNASYHAIHHWRMKEEEVGHRILMIKLYWLPWKKMKVLLPDYWLRCIMSTNQPSYGFHLLPRYP